MSEATHAENVPSRVASVHGIREHEDESSSGPGGCFDEPTLCPHRRGEEACTFVNFDGRPGKYMVALAAIHEGIDSPEFYLARGYRQVQAFPSFVILEKPDGR